jgi:hypothetical protein
MVTLATYTFWIFLKSGTTKHAIYASSAESVKEAVRKK